MEKKIDVVTVGDIQTNCWLYSLDENPDPTGRQPCVVIDPGEESELIVSRLQKLNWIPVHIFLTHGHFDHVAALPALLEACKKGAFGPGPLPSVLSPSVQGPIVGIHRLDASYLGNGALDAHRNSFSAVGGDPSYVNALWEPLPDADILFEEADTAGPFTVLHLPGHTPGSVGFYDEKAGVLFSGDTLFRFNIGRTDLPGGNFEQMRQSLKRLLSMDGEILVCPGHGDTTTIGETSKALTNFV